MYDQPDVRRNLILAGVTFVVVVLVSGLAAAAFLAHLPEHPLRAPLAASAAVAGFVVGVFLGGVVYRLPAHPVVQGVVVVVLVASLVLPAGSMFVPGTVTYSRVGLTVYGAIPVPALDITISANGVLGFRDKTLQISRVEVGELVTPDVEVVIIGTGWYEDASVQDDARLFHGVEVIVSNTPSAFDLFNEMRRNGRVVVLLAHTT